MRWTRWLTVGGLGSSGRGDRPSGGWRLRERARAPGARTARRGRGAANRDANPLNSMRGRNAVIEGFDDPDDIGVPTTGILRGTSSSTASMTSNLSWVTLVNMRERQRVDLR